MMDATKKIKPLDQGANNIPQVSATIIWAMGVYLSLQNQEHKKWEMGVTDEKISSNIIEFRLYN